MYKVNKALHILKYVLKYFIQCFLWVTSSDPQTLSHMQLKQRTFKNIVAIEEFAYYEQYLLNPFPHPTNMQQTTLNIFCQNIENLFNWMDNLRLKVENIVAKGEIARFVQFLLLSLCFQKAVCCRGIRKCLYEGKG